MEQGNKDVTMAFSVMAVLLALALVATLLA
jgi:hypothetical protein